jgi:CheY-like chemotaxis protein
VIHGDGDVLDLMTRWFEASGFEVISAVTAFRAQAQLDGKRTIDVVIAPWDTAHPVGGEVYRWMLGHRPELRTRFVFVADDVPPEFDAVVGGRCLAVPLAALDELARIAHAVVSRTRTPPRGLPTISDRPTLLLADDDPVLLEVMAELLHDSGYTVIAVEGGEAAIAALEARTSRMSIGRTFDAIILDWRMHDRGGDEVFEWIVDNAPQLVARVVFLYDGQDISQDTDRPIFRKGQDSQALVGALRDIVKAVRA